MADSKLFIPGLNYFKQSAFISNSEFGEFWDWLRGIRKPDLRAAYDFGNLLDGIVTEPELVDFENRRVTLADGGQAEFTIADFEKAKLMQQTAYKDPIINSILQNMEFQHEKYVDEFDIGNGVKLPVRIKMDGNAKRIKTGFDLKSTQCTTLDQFIASLYHFNYDRQGAFYMDVEGCERFWFVGVGKKPLKNGTHPVFKFAFKKGDAFYLGGKKKYTHIAHKYNNLIHSLNPQLL